jgi:hypothetical protein
VDYSEITPDLLIGRTPRRDDYALLRELGVGLVINMRFERPPYPDIHFPPLHFLWLPAFDSPFFPIPMQFLRRGVTVALATIEKGGRVYTHCAVGAHRGVAMGAAILIAQGCEAGEAMRLIKQKRKGADPDMWYIRRRIVRFAREWAQANHPA